jgi:hypothetical protein
MDPELLKREILANGEEIERLRRRVHDTAARRGDGERAHEEWLLACSEFHARYMQLGFPGGYEGAGERVLEGDPLAMEAAICFLELRPYFFRSGYLFQSLLRKARRAPLSDAQRLRFDAVVQRQELWRQRQKVDACAT